MTTSRFPDLPEITDELLSAYIDNAVTESERARIEQALREDSNIAWRLATLRETVQMLRALPMLNAPRAFVLTPEMVGQRHAEPAATASVFTQKERPTHQSTAPSVAQAGWWARLVDGWRTFWAEGNPVWRNALATSMAALLVLLALPALLRSNTASNLPTPSISMAVQSSHESAAAPANEAMAEISTAAADDAVVVNPAGRESASAAAEGHAEVSDLAAAQTVDATEASAVVATGAEDVAMAAPAEKEVVAGAAVRVIPGERATEDALGGIANAESAPAYAAAVSAPAAPEMAAVISESVAAPESAMSAATDTPGMALTLTSPAAGESVGASIAAPAGAGTDGSLAAAAPTAMPTATALPTASVMPTAAAASTTAAVAAAATTAGASATAPAMTPAATTTAFPSILPWLQWAALVGVVAFGFLWWRSRRI